MLGYGDFDYHVRGRGACGGARDRTCSASSFTTADVADRLRPALGHDDGRASRIAPKFVAYIERLTATPGAASGRRPRTRTCHVAGGSPGCVQRATIRRARDAAGVLLLGDAAIDRYSTSRCCRHRPPSRGRCRARPAVRPARTSGSASSPRPAARRRRSAMRLRAGIVGGQRQEHAVELVDGPGRRSRRRSGGADIWRRPRHCSPPGRSTAMPTLGSRAVSGRICMMPTAPPGLRLLLIEAQFLEALGRQQERIEAVATAELLRTCARSCRKRLRSSGSLVRSCSATTR